jgi:hypothetical protein
MIEAGGTEHVRCHRHALRSVVPAAPGVDMVSLPTLLRNAEQAQSEGRVA